MTLVRSPTGNAQGNWPPEELEEIRRPYESNGMQFEALEAARCVVQGKMQSDVMPWKETNALMETMDLLRKKWQLSYANDTDGKVEVTSRSD